LTYNQATSQTYKMTQVHSQEWLVSKRVNRAGEGDDDPAIIDPLLANRR